MYVIVFDTTKAHNLVAMHKTDSLEEANRLAETFSKEVSDHGIPLHQVFLAREWVKPIEAVTHTPSNKPTCYPARNRIQGKYRRYR